MPGPYDQEESFGAEDGFYSDECPDCLGSGQDDDGGACHTCNGDGYVN